MKTVASGSGVTVAGTDVTEDEPDPPAQASVSKGAVVGRPRSLHFWTAGKGMSSLFVTETRSDYRVEHSPPTFLGVKTAALAAWVENVDFFMAADCCAGVNVGDSTFKDFCALLMSPDLLALV